MAVRAKSSQTGRGTKNRRACPTCGGESKVVQFTGFGPKGFFWVCEQNPEHAIRTR